MNRGRLRLSDACLDALTRARQPVVTRFDILTLIGRVAHDRGYHGASVYALKSQPIETDYRRVIQQLLEERQLAPDRDFAASVFTVNRIPDAPADTACCIVDPYCYVSHMSAMQHYGLTDRIPEALILTRPASPLWSQMAEQTVIDLQAQLQEATDGFRNFRPRRYEVPDIVRGRPVLIHTTKTPGRAIRERNGFVRLARVEQTFCDMLTEPSLCGGMTHVLEVWRDHAKTYLERIIAAVDDLGSSIAKVRAGYILEELLRVNDPTVDSWHRFAQRGGSRLLDPTRSYQPVYSEGWMISLNADLPAL